MLKFFALAVLIGLMSIFASGQTSDKPNVQSKGQSLNDEQTFEIMLASLKDKRWEYRSQAAWTLGKIGNRRAVEPLIAALKDENWEVRENVVWALGDIKDVRAIEPLINTLNDKRLEVRKGAAKFLKEITGQDFGLNAVKWQKWWKENKEKFQP